MYAFCYKRGVLTLLVRYCAVEMTAITVVIVRVCVCVCVCVCEPVWPSGKALGW